MKRRLLFALAAILLLAADCGWGREAQVINRAIKPGPTDKCPVCGMFVAKYPDFCVVVTFNDGAHVFFDGVKDMARYYFNMQKYAPSRSPVDIHSVQVVDYYNLVAIDGLTAFYVSGSDIYGPMGIELIPFEKKQDAEEFMRDHNGKALLPFKSITTDVLKQLD